MPPNWKEVIVRLNSIMLGEEEKEKDDTKEKKDKKSEYGEFFSEDKFEKLVWGDKKE